MALNKRKDPLDDLKAEAEEAGINLSRAEDGTYAAFVQGGASLDGYKDPRALLDDMLALTAMDAKSDVFVYDEDEQFGDAIVTVNGGGTFTAKTFAQAYAEALESLNKPKAEPKARKPRKAKAEAEEAPKNGAEPNGTAEGEGAISMSDNVRIMVETLNTVGNTLLRAAQKLSASDALLPFVGEEFADDEKPLPPELAKFNEDEAPKRRVTREKGK